MKGSHLFLCLFSVSCWLNLMPTSGNRIFHFGRCRVSMSMTEIRLGFTAIKASIQARDPIKTLSILSHPQSLHKVKSSDRCCITHHLFNFYVDKVFKHCKTEDSYINRKISSIANSFLSMKKKLRQCLNVTSAAIKSLGELDILLDWMEKSQRAEHVNNPPTAGTKEAAGTLHTPVVSRKIMCCTTADSH
ncbi:interleukin-20-like isoform X2 [Strigops habroptila]|uniref:interleukin-20-like isoform X2 n=1 Tax=Strigops habroptila TaxID=2489341 RepID=UPI0011D00E8C|nr:interleukin-20-like isoform X2 [Strigops habroptila]